MDAWREFAGLIEEFGTSVFNLGAFVGIIVAIAVFVVEVRWTRTHPPRDRQVERARELGHVVEAKRVRFWDDALTPDERTTSWYHAVYSYEVSGGQYEYKYMERAYPPATMKLYYIDNPRRAFHEKKGRSSVSKLLLLVIPLAAGLGIMYLLGGI